VREDDDVVRSMIQHENTLRDQRLGWCLALNGFLFTALSFAWDQSDASPVTYVLCLVGLSTAGATAASMQASNLAIRRLRRWHTEHSTGDGPPVVGLASEDLRRYGLVGLLVQVFYPWRVLPLALGAAWLAVGLLRLR
jgi:hypothetical protein